ncbi:MAG: nucleotidyltransferase family protein [Candidatus Omnitrophica bacterium]|nr:nucleotidyltransferase family protein [Candidatus Omnitrophota bacterium]
MKALILAAGYARRLYPLTKEFPKPLLLVRHRPIIDYIIDKLESVDQINEIIVVTNSKFISRFKVWASKHPTKKRISLVDDLTKTHSDRRGAIGDMNFAVNKKRIKDDLLVIGGDNLFDGDLNVFLDFAKARRNKPVIGAYNIRKLHAAREYGVIKLDKENRVIDFEEKPNWPKTALIAMCLYYFPKEKLKLIREYLDVKTAHNDATGFYIDWLTKRERVFAFIFHGRWFDIGHHKFYEEAKHKFFMV